jgi:hypothetical protein
VLGKLRIMNRENRSEFDAKGFIHDSKAVYLASSRSAARTHPIRVIALTGQRGSYQDRMQTIDY